MAPLSPAALLDLWERGREIHPVDRAVLLLGAALPDRPRESLADLPIGRRDALLAALRSATFGPEARAFLDCPMCGERLEFAFDVRAFHPPLPDEHEDPVVQVDGRRFRVPASRDLHAIAGVADPERAAMMLVERCWIPEGDAPEWTAELLEAVEARLSEVDPQGDVSLALRCVVCAEAFETALEIGAFLWEEITARARHLLEEVHLLARAYGWPEREVLALSELRRAAYIEMLRA